MTKAITDILSQALASFEDKSLEQAFRKYLVVPKQSTRTFYGATLDQVIPIWIVADFSEVDVQIGYSESGYGSLGTPWGLVSSDSSDTGDRSHWYRTLEACVIDSSWVEELDEWRRNKD